MTLTPRRRTEMLAYYDALSGWLEPAIRRVSDDGARVRSEGRDVFDGMLAEIPYVDRPEHSMASSMYPCAAMLALFEVLRGEGVDAHAWGRALHALPPPADPLGEAADRLARDAEDSQRAAAPGEFVFALVARDAHGDGGLDIRSCAICHLFGRRGAMDLVPYMCAFDDVVSDARGQGLRRTGTIALGATHCDFRFRAGDPLRLAEQYPDRIRLEKD